MSNSAMTLGEWLGAHEAAELLDVTESDVMEYVSQGQFCGVCEGTEGGVLIPKDEVFALRERSRNSSQDSFYATSLPVLNKMGEVSQAGVGDMQSNLLRTFEEFFSRSAVSHKLLLTIDEAHQISGLPKAYLREAIKRHKLMAVQIARKWLIKRSELQSFIDSL